MRFTTYRSYLQRPRNPRRRFYPWRWDR